MATIKAYAWQFAAMALAALLAVQTVRLANAERDHARAVGVFNAAAARAERDARQQSEAYRTLEGQNREQIAKIGAETSAAIAAANAGARRARAAHDGMQRDLADYIAAHRRAAQARAAAGQCTPDPAALDLLADLQRRADARAGELAEIADAARNRGAGCERAYDAGDALNDAGLPAKP
ncbi:DUF2514 family protein [Diaphorobacter nitroreducens]